MGNAASASWMTKYGRRRVRNEPPTIEEALAAASGLTDDPAEQIVLAANLMQVPLEEVRAQAERIAAARPKQVQMKASVQIVQSRGTMSSVVVERKPQRKLMAGAVVPRGGLRRSG